MARAGEMKPATSRAAVQDRAADFGYLPGIGMEKRGRE
jgi:hypothetical protein